MRPTPATTHNPLTSFDQKRWSFKLHPTNRLGAGQGSSERRTYLTHAQSAPFSAAWAPNIEVDWWFG
jgi:hypothetical protein